MMTPTSFEPHQCDWEYKPVGVFCRICRRPASFISSNGPVAQRSPQYDPADWSLVTICITYYLRLESLERLLKSIAIHCRGATVLMEDTGGNLSAGRNRLVERCRTPFVCMMEEDFEIIDGRAIPQLLDVVANDERVGLACGSLEENKQVCHYSYMMDLFRGVMTLSEPAGEWLLTAHGTKYRLAECGANWFVARRETLRANPWDERLALMEHVPWFWALKLGAVWRVGYAPDAVVRHHKDRSLAEYNEARSATSEFHRLQALHYGIDRIEIDGRPAVRRATPKGNPRPGFPNVAVLAVGHSGTRTITRQLAELGWRLNDADDRFAESVQVREINEQWRTTREFDADAAARAIDRMAQPWIIKDPRFVLNLDKWAPILASRGAALVYVTRSAGSLARSYTLRGHAQPGAGIDGQPAIWGRTLEELDTLARRQFDQWTGPKVGPVPIERIAEACRLCDPARVLPDAGVPRIQHRYWDETGRAMPNVFRHWIERWEALHSKWEHRWWNDRDARAFLAQHYPDLLRCYETALNPAAKSDAIRHAAVHAMGGVYLDVDFRPIRAIDELLAGCNAFVVAHETNGKAICCAGVFGAEAGHPLMERIVAELPNRWDPPRQWKTGPRLVDSCAVGYGDCRILESRLFFPMDFYQREEIDWEHEYPGAFAVHHFDASWVPNVKQLFT